MSAFRHFLDRVNDTRHCCRRHGGRGYGHLNSRRHRRLCTDMPRHSFARNRTESPRQLHQHRDAKSAEHQRQRRRLKGPVSRISSSRITYEALTGGQFSPMSVCGVYDACGSCQRHRSIPTHHYSSLPPQLCWLCFAFAGLPCVDSFSWSVPIARGPEFIEKE